MIGGIDGVLEVVVFVGRGVIVFFVGFGGGWGS